MGLGKTLQTLCFMMWLQKQMEHGCYPKKPLLVVAPTGLLANWAQEAERFFPQQGLGKPLNAHGQSFSKLVRTNERQAKSDLEQTDWAVTTYETLRDKINVFIAVDFALVVFDEAQRIKNPGAMVTDMAKALKSEMTIALSGTPVENSMRDIWCIVDAVKPGALGSCRDFMKKYGDDSINQQTPLLELKEQLTRGQPALLLRRLKEEHWKEKPRKREEIYQDEMPEIQAAAYSALIEKAKARQRDDAKGEILAAIQGLRQISLHCPFRRDADVYRLPEQSARIARTLAILDGLAKKSEKCLIFVEFVETQAAMAEIIARRYGCGPVPIINGLVPGTNRLKMATKFQESNAGDFAVMLISPKAGGVGLNLTAATHVIHLSRWWNPAVEDQCSDRVYRIGQKADVTIHYPLAIHPQFGDKSFDVNLHNLLSKKRILSQSLLAPVRISEGEALKLLCDSIC
jgi:SNF2 family DNA or RNA helicase